MPETALSLLNSCTLPGSFADGHINGDGKVDFQELVLPARNFGQPLPG